MNEKKDDFDEYLENQLKDKKFKKYYKKEKEKKSYMISFRLPDDKAIELRQIAKEKGTTVSELVREILREALGMDKKNTNSNK